MAKERQRRIRVEGWFILQPSDGAYYNPLSEIMQAMLDGDIDFSVIDNLVLREELER